MSRTRRVLGGTGIGYAHQAAVLLVGLWLTPFLLTRIGQHDLGLWLVVGQVVGYLGLIELGVIAILPREVAFLSGRASGDTESAIGRLLAHVRRIVRRQTIALAALCVLVWMLLPAEWQALRGPLLIVFVGFVALYPARVDLAVLQGVQELAFVAKLQLLGWALSTAVAIGLVLAGAGLYALVIGWLGLLAVPAIAASVTVRTRWRHGIVPAPTSAASAHASGTPDADAVTGYFTRSAWVSVSQFAYVLLNGSDLLLLSWMLGPAAVVPYACTGKLVTVFANHPQLLMHSAQPALSELRMSGSRSQLASVATALTQTMLIMSGAIAVIVLPLNHFFVQWWVGPSLYAGWGLTLALTLMMVLRHWNVATVQTLFCFGHERQLSLTALLDGVATTIATALLVWKFGFIGAPIASIAAVLLISLPVNLRSVAGEMGLRTGAFVASIAPLFAVIAAIGGLASAAAWWLEPLTLTSAMLLFGPVALLYGAAVIPFAWRGPVGPYLRGLLPRFGRSAAAARPVWHIVTCESRPQVGGVSDHTGALAAALAGRGEAVQVWSPAIEGSDPGAEPGVHRTLGGFSLVDCLRTGRALNRETAPRRLFVQWVPHGYGAKGMNLWFAAWLAGRAWLRRDELHVMVHEPYVELSPQPAVMLVGMVQRLMLALVCSGATRVWLSIPPWTTRLRRYVPNRVPMSWLPVPACAIVPADADAVAAVRQRTVANGPLVGHFSTYAPPVRPLLAATLAGVLERSAAHALLVGRGSHEFKEQFLAAHPAFSSRVHAIGVLNDAALAAHLGACDVFVQPYPDGISARRTSALLPLSLGRAIVTNKGHLTEAFWTESHAVALADGPDPSAIAARALTLITNTAEQARLGARASALYDLHFDIRHAVAQLEQAA